jgi:pseudouridine-5'-phosphate glycosidase/pseudouridine kinase
MYRCRPPRSWLRPSNRRYHAAAPDSAIFRIAPEVRSALAANEPVVALETTIYTHGFPHPANLALAQELDATVRRHGGVPAHIGVLGGVARVGLDAGELERLVSRSGPLPPRKLSRRDLAAALCQNETVSGGTTIAGTMALAHLAGIRVFATGGLGGVHRGGHWDVSADLTELGRTPVAVVSGGCKGFLDVAATLEYLETQGVGVFTLADGAAGQVDYPAFWSRESGCPSPGVVRDEEEAARIIRETSRELVRADRLDAQFSLPLHSGLHFAAPIPREAAIPKREMEDVIAKAIGAADAEGATGKDNTPFILSKINELTSGRSIAANRALIAASVKRGTLIAKELCKLQGHFLG